MKIYKIKDIATVQSGVFLRETPNGDTHYLQVKDFNEKGEFNTFHPSIYLSEKEHKHLLREQDLVFAAKGFTNFCAVYSSQWGSPATVASSSFLVLKIIQKSVILPEYLCWILNREDILLQLKSKTAGSAMPSISKQVMEELEIAVPSIEIQEKITTIDALQKQEQKLYEKIAKQKRNLINQQLKQIINK
jgi:restriction endonuclease S subunit